MISSSLCIGLLVGLPGLPTLRLLPWFHFLSPPTVRRFLSFLRRCSDLVESPFHYETGSPFGPSLLLVYLLACPVQWSCPRCVLFSVLHPPSSPPLLPTMVRSGSLSSWVSSPFDDHSPPYSSVLCWVSWGFVLRLVSLPCALALPCWFLRLWRFPFVCPPHASTLALAWVF